MGHPAEIDPVCEYCGETECDCLPLCNAVIVQAVRMHDAMKGFSSAIQALPATLKYEIRSDVLKALSIDLANTLGPSDSVPEEVPADEQPNDSTKGPSDSADNGDSEGS